MGGKRRAVVVGIVVVAILCAGFVGALIWYKSPRPIPVPGVEGVLSVNIMVVEEARDEYLTPTLTPEQAQQIVECVGRYSMSRGSEKKYSMHIVAPYYYITVWFRNAEGEKYNVNVCNVAEHSTVQFGEKHHAIFDSAPLFAQLWEILDCEDTQPSATPEPAVTVEDVALLSGLPLADGEEPRVVATGENVALMAVDERYPASSPYYSEGGGVSGFTKAVYAVSCVDGQVLRTLTFDDGLSYCEVGAVNAQGVALQLLCHEPESLHYEVLLFPDGESEPVVAESGRWDGVSVPQMALLTGGGIAYTWGSQTETGECVYGLRVRGMDGALVQEISLTGDTLEALNTSLTADGEQFLFTTPQTAYLGDSQQNRTVFEAEPEGEIFGGIPLSDQLLLHYRAEADGPERIGLLTAEGEILAGQEATKRYGFPIKSGEKLLSKGSGNYFSFTLTDGSFRWWDTGIAADYDESYSLGNGRFLLWDRSQKSARVLTLA